MKLLLFVSVELILGWGCVYFIDDVEACSKIALQFHIVVHVFLLTVASFKRIAPHKGVWDAIDTRFQPFTCVRLTSSALIHNKASSTSTYIFQAHEFYLPTYDLERRFSNTLPVSAFRFHRTGSRMNESLAFCLDSNASRIPRSIRVQSMLWRLRWTLGIVEVIEEKIK